MGKNQTRTLSGLVGLRGWFDPVTDKSERYTLHLDAVMHSARLGGGADDPVRFRVHLKSCQVVVVIPEQHRSEIRIDPRTIARANPENPLSVTKSQTKRNEKNAVVEGSMFISSKAAKIKAAMNGTAQHQTDLKENISEEQTIPVIHWMQGQSEDGYDCWFLSSSKSEPLQGAAWSAHDDPRLEIVDKRGPAEKEKHRSTGFEPEVLVEIRCKREDLEITDISLKDAEAAGFASNQQDGIVRQRAAEAFIKRELMIEGLKVGDLSEIFADMVIADHIVPIEL